MSAATEHLSKADQKLGALIARVGTIKRAPPDFQEPYHALLSAVAHQQLHARAALSILGRLTAHFDHALPAPEALLAMPNEILRGCGFSASKAAALRDIAEKAMAGVIPSRAQAMRLSDAALVERLTTIRGVGQWTVEMLLMFTLRRPDVFPVDDFGVREGYRILHGLAAQPKPKQFAEIGQAFAPYRSTAAMYLWRACDAAKPVKVK
jgi:DNA-3-methyladenine glycosylase II